MQGKNEPVPAIEDLKDRYSVVENIDFVVRTAGKAEQGKPNYHIFKSIFMLILCRI